MRMRDPHDRFAILVRVSLFGVVCLSGLVFEGYLRCGLLSMIFTKLVVLHLASFRYINLLLLMFALDMILQTHKSHYEQYK